MKSFSKRFSSILAAVALLGTLIARVPTAAAAGCPTNPVAEQGGSHWCYDSGTSGHVHLWTPANFNAVNAYTVVYIHGYNLNAAGSQVRDASAGVDGCVNNHYIDCAWDKHSLARQFARSGQNALFVAIEGPSNSDQGVKWSSLNTLLQDIRSNGNGAPPNAVTVVAHSAGIFTAAGTGAGSGFLRGGLVTHLALLDTMYGRENPVKNWLNSDTSHQALKLTLVAGSAQKSEMKAVSTSLHCTEINGVPASFNDAMLSTPCVYIDSKMQHSQTVKSGTVIPLILSRSSAPTAPGNPATPGGTVTLPQTSTTADAPRFEVPIPGVTLTSVVGTDAISLPWIGQYVSGVYSFLIGVIGVIAAIMMIIGGFQYLTSAGDAGKIKTAKKRITDALIGLVLAFGSYAMLYTINPELVQFKGLELTTISSVTEETTARGEDNLIQAMELDPSPVGSATKPQTLCTSISACLTYCNGDKADTSKVPPATSGMASRDQVTPILNNAGLNGFGHLASPQTVTLLAVAGQLAAAEGYKIAVSSGWRDLQRQVDLVCAAHHRNEDRLVGHTIAWPGGSFHGVGYAVDVQLWKDGQKLTISGDSDAQQSEDPAEAKKLAEIMLKAGFRRLNNEIWHFEPLNAPAIGCRCTTLNDCSMPPNVQC